MTRHEPGAAWKLTRSRILLVGGLLGTAHETVVAASPRPYLLLLFASMMGLASFIKLDDLLTSKRFKITLDTPDQAENASGRNGP